MRNITKEEYNELLENINVESIEHSGHNIMADYTILTIEYTDGKQETVKLND